MSRSSIFSFNTLLRWQAFPAGLATGLLILLSIELLVVRSDWFVRRYSATSLGVVYALESRVIEGAAPRIVCLGDSRMRDCIAPRILEQELGLPDQSVLNLALTAGTPFDSLVLYRRNRAALRRADLLVIDFEYHFFGTAPRPSPRVIRFSTREDRARLFTTRKEWVPATVGAVWQTFGLREFLRGALLNPGGLDLKIAEDGRIVWRTEAWKNQLNIRADMIDKGRPYSREQVDDRFARECEGLIELAREDGLKVVLLHVPLREEFVEYLQGAYPETYRRNREEFRNRPWRVDLLLDWETGANVGVSDSDYYDYGHMMDAGAERFSSLVAEELRPLVALASALATEP